MLDIVNRVTGSSYLQIGMSRAFFETFIDCWARHVNGHAAAPASPAMNSRRRINHLISRIVDTLSRAELHVWR
jgi:hypothetical protein